MIQAAPPLVPLVYNTPVLHSHQAPLEMTPEGIEELVASDRDALVSFYAETGGSSWHDNSNWDTNADLGRWYGVTVRQRRVVKLYLPNNNLQGKIGPLP